MPVKHRPVKISRARGISPQKRTMNEKEMQEDSICGSGEDSMEDETTYCQEDNDKGMDTTGLKDTDRR